MEIVFFLDKEKVLFTKRQIKSRDYCKSVKAMKLDEVSDNELFIYLLAVSVPLQGKGHSKLYRKIYNQYGSSIAGFGLTPNLIVDLILRH